MARQRQDALVHRNHLNERALGRARRREVDGHLGVGPLHFGRSDIQLERARRHIHRHMADANRAARLRRLHGVARRIDRRHDVDASAPFARDRQREVGALVGFHRHGARGYHVLGCNHDLGLARIGRHDRDIDALADRRHLVRNLHADTVWRLDAILRLSAPARPEAVGGFAAIGFLGEVDFEIAIVERAGLQRAFLALGDVELSGFQFNDTARLAPLPCAAALAIPVVLPVDADQAPVDLGSLERARPVDRHHLEARRLALFGGPVVERGLHADITGFRTIGDADIVPHRTPARLDCRHHGAQAQRTAGFAVLGSARVKRQHGAALSVGHRGGEIERGFAELLVMTAERKPFEVRERVRVGLDAHIAFDRQVGAGSAVVEAHVGRDRARFALTHRRSGVGLQLQLDALRNEVFDRKRLGADNANAVDLGLDPPAAARRGFRDREGINDRAVILLRVLEAQTARLKPVGAIDDDRSGAVAQGDGGCVADQCADLHGFAGAIDATLCIDECVGFLRRFAPANIALGQVDRRTVEVEDREVAVGRIRHQDAGRDIALAAHDRAGEVHAAGAVRIAARQHFIVAGDQFQLHSGHRLGRLQ